MAVRFGLTEVPGFDDLRLRSANAHDPMATPCRIAVGHAIMHVNQQADLDLLEPTDRVLRLRDRTMRADRWVSFEQAALVTEAYQRHEGQPRAIQRARAFAHVCDNLEIAIDSDEWIVGNRTAGIRAGVVFPEAAVAWYEEELHAICSRPQDRFLVDPSNIEVFQRDILPYWRGKTLEDRVYTTCGEEISRIGKVAKINQRDHAQGHIIPSVTDWLRYGPTGLVARVEPSAEGFPACVVTVLDGARRFIERYAALAREQGASATGNEQEHLERVAACCERIAVGVPETFHEAVQSLWFLFVLLHLESNASSFSPGRLDQYLRPYLDRDLAEGRLDLKEALELIECLWIKFNQIVYMRNAHSAEFFAGFPIGFNVCIGGQTATGQDATNLLSFLCLKAQAHLGLPQPNLSARLHETSPPDFLDTCVQVIGQGSGMPQVFNDESIVPALERQGIEQDDAMDYAVVGCVELSTQGNNLGWSDAAMFNLVKAMELALNHGVCLLTGDQIGPDSGGLDNYGSYEELETAFAAQIDHFTERMMKVCAEIERIHADVLPTALLSSVVNDCLERGIDVTAGGAHYNLSGIQGIQVANVADSLGALKHLAYDPGHISPTTILDALRSNFEGREALRCELLYKAPKYGNDIRAVDDIGTKWARYFAEKIEGYQNPRGGPCHTGFYTVSAHVPMGRNVGATPDGRFAGSPLADGGVSAVYGRDEKGPTALLKSVSRLPFHMASNGTLLNMKFLPSFFETQRDRRTFAALLRGLVRMGIHHAQFNVVRKEDLLAAQENPEAFRHLTVRVAGYTAYFVELAGDLQDEIIARTSFGEDP